MQNVSLDVPVSTENSPQVFEEEIEFNKKDMQQIENPECEQVNPFQPEKSLDDAQFTPIAALTTNTNDWIIKARLSKKYERKSWTN